MPVHVSGAHHGYCGSGNMQTVIMLLISYYKI